MFAGLKSNSDLVGRPLLQEVSTLTEPRLNGEPLIRRPRIITRLCTTQIFLLASSMRISALPEIAYIFPDYPGFGP